MKIAATAWAAPVCPPNQMRTMANMAMPMARNSPPIDTAIRFIAAGVVSEAKRCSSTVRIMSCTKNSATRRAQVASRASLTE